MGKQGFEKVIVTGGAGFIGSHMVDYIVVKSLANKIVVIDNFSSGSIKNVEHHIGKDYFELINADLKSFESKWVDVFKDADAVFHFAANPEVRISSTDPRIHFNENIVATFNVLEAARKFDVTTHFFASSSTVYGDADKIPTPEDHALKPISVYGASKAACEMLYYSYSHLYGFNVAIGRYANIIGYRSNHGVIIDFINKLRKNPNILEILGDGTQRKSYLHVSDAVEATAIITLYAKERKGYHVFNIGNDDWITVKEIADITVNEMELKNVQYKYILVTPDGRGWPGDVKLMLLDITKIKSLTSWRPKLSSKDAVRKTVREILGKEKFSWI
ncbi:NAD-dependent epimerase/dehydratase family protein [Ignisphaera sp. 4213-co]|uniref:NAD-dependent epimerase/dehydratase family protein n=1 Tax=Ignisphaera cupida TaxID=3050454 RepID=A0ABD4Z605_9CREN|nr:NAD-dependent epimerase/dehydratase family protein [Ignisphaera sp. 4213-co]MDK6028595.1 NAD-dependent epimerase/dehydratase family protein [Ignisphaera sp. 4213-co]